MSPSFLNVTIIPQKTWKSNDRLPPKLGSVRAATLPKRAVSDDPQQIIVQPRIVSKCCDFFDLFANFGRSYDHMIIWSYDHMIIWSYDRPKFANKSKKSQHFETIRGWTIICWGSSETARFGKVAARTEPSFGGKRSFDFHVFCGIMVTLRNDGDIKEWWWH